ncbi:MAG TPA: histidine ammonia-lyase [Vicinamibacterales bacterium]|nr:histidine ammonia-lyase [Vicinamibacterales bacterium]
MAILLDGSSLTLEQLAAIADAGAEAQLAPAAARRVGAARAVVDRMAAGDAPVYGINTGFGSLAEVRIARDALSELQVNLLRSHASGVGDPLPVRAVRAATALRANVLAKGFSGCRLETVEALLALLNRRVHPRVPSRGSVGASGDLAPLAHLALVLIGEGEAIAEDDSVIPGAQALARAGLQPIALQAKEGLALINGTQPSAAVLALAVLDAQRLARAADIVAALSVDALRGSFHPFEARIHEARPYPGQQAAAANLFALLQNSAINRSHEHCGTVQDAYSLRCAAQVHGAAREAIVFAARIAAIEANAATDNPMVFATGGEAEGDIVSGGNFHGAPVAVAADALAIGVVQLASISERRADRLMNTTLSGLPAFLTRDGGLHSGYMMSQVAAAALVSEMKTVAHPASVDTIPTSANREDHVSMSMYAALKAAHAVALARQVLAIELMCAAQGIDLLAPLETAPPLTRAHALVRSRVAPLERDRPPAPDIAAIDALIADGSLERACGVDVK